MCATQTGGAAIKLRRASFRILSNVDKRGLIWKLAYLAMAGGVFMIDQTTKSWASRSLRFGGDRSIIGGFVNLAYAENPGVAFSMVDQQGVAGRRGLSVCAFR